METEAEAVEWAAEPRAVSSDVQQTTSLLGADTVVEAFVGVVSSEDSPFCVSVEVARATPDDHVVAASVLRRPVGTAEGGMTAVAAPAGGGPAAAPSLERASSPPRRWPD
jgi:hypothetical protein